MTRLNIFLFALLCVVAPFFGSAQANDASESYSSPVVGFSEEDVAKLSAGSTHKFDTEVNKLMSIIINSLYTKNEVFLRELISNGSDSLDKIRFHSLTNPALLGDTPELEIRLRGDVNTNTLSITDTGIGMTREDLVNNLGTIARSGTKDFINQFQEYSDSNLIGQFGVGFYSAFLVADKVTVISKHNDDDKQWVWESTGDGAYTLVEDPRGVTIGRGVQIVLHLKDDATEYAEESTLRQLVQRYSEYINFPIKLWATHTETEEVDLTEEELEAEREKARAAKAAEEEDVEDLDGADAESDEDLDIPTTRTVERVVEEYETLNSVKPLWTRGADEVSDDEYKEFYKAAMKDYQDPLAWSHFSAEGEIEFKALLYVPAQPPAGTFDNTMKKDNMKLFVRRVFITDDFSDILPKYLAFIKGLVDSDDMPLNVSREQLQQHKTLKIIKKKLVRKAIAMFQELKREDEEGYNTFYETYGKALKLGVVEDAANRNRLSKLLKFQSSKSEGGDTFLDDYVERMVPGQDSIYYIGGQSLEEVRSSPHIERLTRRGVEVLFMTDPLDEYCVQNLPKYDGSYSLVDVTKESFKLPGEADDAEAQEELQARFEPLTQWLSSEALAGKVDKVVLSKRLATSPSAIVSSSYGYSANMERIIRAQALGDPSQTQGFMFMGKKTMEINPRHPIVTALLARVEAEDSSPETQSIAEVLYQTARLTSGYDVEDTSSFASLINNVLSRSLGVEGEEVELPEDVDLSTLEVDEEVDAAEEEEEDREEL